MRLESLAKGLPAIILAERKDTLVVKEHVYVRPALLGCFPRLEVNERAKAPGERGAKAVPESPTFLKRMELVLES
jgi:hypothetical protein